MALLFIVHMPKNMCTKCVLSPHAQSRTWPLFCDNFYFFLFNFLPSYLGNTIYIICCMNREDLQRDATLGYVNRHTQPTHYILTQSLPSPPPSTPSNHYTVYQSLQPSLSLYHSSSTLLTDTSGLHLICWHKFWQAQAGSIMSEK